MSPKLRQTIYQLGTIVPALLGLVLIWGGIDAGAAEHIDQIIAGVVALLGSPAPAIAATKVAKQSKDGTFDTLSPVDQVIQNLPVVVKTAADAQADLEKLRQAASDALGSVPVFGDAAQAALDKYLPLDI